jgi:hypothetical protein
MIIMLGLQIRDWEATPCEVSQREGRPSLKLLLVEGNALSKELGADGS